MCVSVCCISTRNAMPRVNLNILFPNCTEMRAHNRTGHTSASASCTSGRSPCIQKKVPTYIFLVFIMIGEMSALSFVLHSANLLNFISCVSGKHTGPKIHFCNRAFNKCAARNGERWRRRQHNEYNFLLVVGCWWLGAVGALTKIFNRSRPYEKPTQSYLLFPNND